jgi:hypothetical protein
LFGVARAAARLRFHSATAACAIARVFGVTLRLPAASSSVTPTAMRIARETAAGPVALPDQ